MNTLSPSELLENSPELSLDKGFSLLLVSGSLSAGAATLMTGTSDGVGRRAKDCPRDESERLQEIRYHGNMDGGPNRDEYQLNETVIQFGSCFGRLTQ